MTRCDDYGQSPETCLLALGHEGFHKSNHRIWPNAAESAERWAAIGRRLMAGEPMPHLSYRELRYAIEAADTYPRAR